MNCRGLGNRNKRTDVFDFFKSNRKSHIYCLQDVHWDEKRIDQVTNEWGSECFISCGTTNSRGVAILFNNNFDYDVAKVDKDVDGNYVALSLRIYGYTITLISVYGPNDDRPSFYKKINDLIAEFDNTHCIIVGDWNLTLCQNLDTFNYLHENNPHSKKTVIDLLNNEDLVDVWRVQHPNEKSFTWRQRNPLKQGRLDFFVLSSGLMNTVVSSSICHGYRSDHSLIQCNFKLNKIVYGRGYWKFNSCLLQDEHYINLILQVINETISEYSCSPYDKTKVCSMNGNDICFVIDDQLFFETLLCNIRGKSISYSAHIKKVNSEREQFLIKEIDWMENNLSENSWKLNYVDSLKDELQNIRFNKVKGILLRSRAQRVEEDEKPSRYFLNLEKKKFEEKLISHLKTDNDNDLYDVSEIKDEVYKFYKELYRTRDCNLTDLDLSKDLISNSNILSDKEAQGLEGPLTFSEAYHALKKYEK